MSLGSENSLRVLSFLAHAWALVVPRYDHDSLFVCDATFEPYSATEAEGAFPLAVPFFIHKIVPPSAITDIPLILFITSSPCRSMQGCSLPDTLPTDWRDHVKRGLRSAKKSGDNPTRSWILFVL